MENINFGIDLGTTNSGIGKYENGKVKVLKNPVGLKETLPSVVSFYRGRTLVGDKAREQYLSNSGNVLSAFKRKMGSDERYTVDQGTEKLSLSAKDLSAYVLKELKNYVQGADMPAAVITIPASFDTIQSNATKEAGYSAGFKQVMLLQEPIAACLAYANLSELSIEEEQKWLVYDFGGGTFDTALVHINARELKVIDNKGNNFLGGVDIDHAFITEVIIPKLVVLTGDAGIWDKIMIKEPLYEKLWHYLVYLAEEAKKQLSVATEAWIEVDFPELDIFLDIAVDRHDLNEVVRPKYEESERFIADLLEENDIKFGDISRIILVGGTTYIPYIKDKLRETSGVIVDDSVDPTTAVIVGAAYYAGTQQVLTESLLSKNQEEAKLIIDIKLSYESHTNDLEELIAFKTLSSFSGSYRITRADGGYDSGSIAFSDAASEFITLLPKAQNIFKLAIFDEKQHTVFEKGNISISQGLYNVSGQLLPEDICIELDGNDKNTYLEVVFKRNNILPLSKTLYKTFSRSIIKNTDDNIVINVVEGKGGTMPGACVSIGYIEISGKDIDNDLIQGTDIEIQLSMDESRGLKVEVYIPSGDQQISQSFHLAQREINVHKTTRDIDEANATIQKEIAYCNAKEAFELSAKFQALATQLEDLKLQLIKVANDTLTQERYRVDERKRKLIGDLDNLTRARDLHLEIVNYQNEKERYLAQEEHATDTQKNNATQILDHEKEMMRSGDKHFIKKRADELNGLNNKIFLQNDESYVRLFLQFSTLPEEYYYPNANREELIAAGRHAMDNRDMLQLRQVVVVLFDRIRDELKQSSENPAQVMNSIGNSRTGLK